MFELFVGQAAIVVGLGVAGVERHTAGFAAAVVVISSVTANVAVDESPKIRNSEQEKQNVTPRPAEDSGKSDQVVPVTQNSA